MTHLRQFFLFWYDFIVGDDWVIAAGVVAAVIVTWLLVQLGVQAWWMIPAAVVVLLAASIWREAQP